MLHVRLALCVRRFEALPSEDVKYPPRRPSPDHIEIRVHGAPETEE